MSRKEKIIIFIASILIVLIFAFDALLFLKTSQTISLKGFGLSDIKIPKAYIIQSGSMEPAIKTGSVVFVYSAGSYAPGDVITYSLDKSNKNLVTHRIDFKTYPNGINSAPFYTTSGDANRAFDASQVKQENIVGKVALSIPFLGYFAGFAKTLQGFILLIIVPSTIIIYEELRFIKKEILKKTGLTKEGFFKKFRLFKSKDQSLEAEAKGAAKALIIVPLLGSILIFIALTNSYFSDKDISNGSTFTASIPTTTPVPGTPTPTPITDHVVINEVYYFVCTQASVCGNNPQNEWVELYNPSSSSFDLSGWTLTDNSSTDSIPAGTSIAPHGFLVVTPEAHTFDIWSSVPSNERVILGGNIGNGLKDDGDSLILKDNLNSTADAISYGDDTSQLNPAIVGVVRGHSIERIHVGFDSNLGSDFIDQTNPSPGVGLP